MRIFIDTEFYEHDDRVELISLGAVDENNREFYWEFSKFDWKTVTAQHWIRKNVQHYLLGAEKIHEWQLQTEHFGSFGSDEDFRAQFTSWAGKHPEFWGWYCDYDWVALCQKMGTMVDLPDTWPMHCLDLRQECQRLNLTVQTAEELGFKAHNALEDAKWTCLVGTEILQIGGW